jgi:hypothetical protein
VRPYLLGPGNGGMGSTIMSNGAPVIRGAVGAVYKFANPVDPSLETAWFRPSNL